MAAPSAGDGSTTTASTSTTRSPSSKRRRRLSNGAREVIAQTRPSKLKELADKLQPQPQLLPPQPELLPKPEHNVYMYSSLVAGVGSGALSSILCAPLDLVRVRMQVWGQVLREQTNGSAAAGSIATRAATAAAQAPQQAQQQEGTVALIGRILKEIQSREGPKGFFRGLGATLLTVPAFWGVYCKLVHSFF